MIGFEKNDKAILVAENYLGLKKPCLIIKEGNKARKIASFKDEESANLFLDVICEIFGREQI